MCGCTKRRIVFGVARSSFLLVASFTHSLTHSLTYSFIPELLIMKRKATDADASETDTVSKKQIIEVQPAALEDQHQHQHQDQEQTQAPLPKKSATKKGKNEDPIVVVDEVAVNGKTSKTPKTTKTPKKLATTTPRKKAERTIYAASIDSSAPTLRTNESPPQAIPKAQPIEIKQVPPSSEKKKKSTEVSPGPIVEKKSETDVNEDSIDLLGAIDLGLFGASWFFFGIVFVWGLLNVFQPESAVILQDRLLDILNFISNSRGSFFVTELVYFSLTILAFHFVLTLVTDLVN
jgi:hypothetical protein